MLVLPAVIVFSFVRIYDNAVTVRKPDLRVIVVASLLLIVAAFAMAPERLTRFLLGFAYQGVMVDEKRWQRWVDENPDLFGPLGETAEFAIVETPDDSTGLVFTRERDGVVVDKKHMLLFDPVPLLLAMKPKTAEELLSLRQSEGDRFWDGVKFLIQRRFIVAHPRVSREELDRVGLTGFLQVIDVTPPEHDERA